MKSVLFSPFQIRDLKFSNRIFVSPMCQYSAVEGVAQPWHMVHLGSRASGGAGLVMAEATAVSPEGRISPGCLGLWSEAQMLALKPIAEFISSQGSVPAIQLAHAGRKASTEVPWKGHGVIDVAKGGWETVAPSPLPFKSGEPTPKELQKKDISDLVGQFVASARLALKAGFQVVELHMAHGYLMNEFLSPVSNHRNDEFGGSIENRMRFPLEVAKQVRAVWPEKWPVFARISATDWVSGGWDLEQSIVLCKELKKLGIDLIDCSSGGNSPDAQIPVGPGYQIPLAQEIRDRCEILTGAVGLITQPEFAENILRDQRADVVFLARAFLKDPYWPWHAAEALKQEPRVPLQYQRARS